jgi:diguanylate cyclase (GGDEF)-like protein
VGYFLATEIIAAALTIVFALLVQPGGAEWRQFLVLGGLALFQAEASRTIERVRKIHVNMISVWGFAGAVVLPWSLVGVLIMVAEVHLWVRVWRGLGNRPAYRVVFSTAMFMLSAFAGTGVLRAGNGVLSYYGWSGEGGKAMVIALAALTFLVVNSAMVFVAASLHRRPEARLVSRAEYTLEAATLCLGALAGVAAAHSAFYVALVVPPVLVLHREVLVKQFEDLAVIDHKTGLLNVAAWYDRARRQLARAVRDGTSFGVLMIDLDHFKRVNDTFGHLAGDEVLKAIARLLENEIRKHDSAGRFGGEEFAVLVPDSSRPEILAIAERLRSRITELALAVPTDTGPHTVANLSASIGVTIYPAGGTTLEQLLLCADRGVYTAKSNGRNQVVVYPQVQYN